MVILIVSHMAFPFSTVSCCHIGFAADNWFHSVFLSLLVELNGSEHVAMIGHGYCGHVKGLDLFKKRIELVGAVEETVLRMEVEMNELGGHSRFPSFQNSTWGLEGSQRKLNKMSMGPNSKSKV